MPEYEGDSPSRGMNLNDEFRSAILSYVPILGFIPLIKSSSNPEVKAHKRNALVLLILELTALIMLTPLGSFICKVVFLMACAIAIYGGYKAKKRQPFVLPFISLFFED